MVYIMTCCSDDQYTNKGEWLNPNHHHAFYCLFNLSVTSMEHYLQYIYIVSVSLFSLSQRHIIYYSTTTTRVCSGY